MWKIVLDWVSVLFSIKKSSQTQNEIMQNRNDFDFLKTQIYRPQALLFKFSNYECLDPALLQTQP